MVSKPLTKSTKHGFSWVQQNTENHLIHKYFDSQGNLVLRFLPFNYWKSFRFKGNDSRVLDNLCLFFLICHLFYFSFFLYSFPLVILHRTERGEREEHVLASCTLLYTAGQFTSAQRGIFLLLPFFSCTEKLGYLLMGTYLSYSETRILMQVCWSPKATTFLPYTERIWFQNEIQLIFYVFMIYSCPYLCRSNNY